MHKRLPIVLLILLLASAVLALPQDELFRPTPMPDRIVLTWNDNPSTSQAVTWRTDTSVAKAVAQIAAADPGPDLEKKAQTVDAVTSELEVKQWKENYHSAVFTNLEPDTLYAYRVGDGDNWSEWLQFRTASAKPKPFSFLYFGDVQNGIRSLASRVIREAFKSAPNARFLVFGGDLVTDGSDDLLWGEFFGAGGWLYGMTPMVPAPGNHEYRGGGLTKHWRAQFTLPENGPEGLAEHAYSTDFQGLRIVVLDTNQVEKQTDWLDKMLSGNPNKWAVVVFHHPVFSVSKGRDSIKIRKALKLILDKHKVDLVLTGHDHTYARSGLQDSTVYVTSVCGSKMYELDREDWMQCAGENMELFQIIRIDGDKLSYESRTAAGDLFDSFVLTKQPGKANRLDNRAPK